MNNNNNPEQQQLNINVPHDHTPTFANNVQIAVTDEEVILQFMYVRPGTKTGNLVSEIALTPKHAIRFQQSLDKTIKNHFTKKIA